MRRTLLLTSLAFGGTIIPGLPVRALAQTTSTAPEVSKSGGIEQVVVTAQRRKENIQKSSLAISVLSAKTLTRAGVTQAQDIPTVAPGVQLGLAGQTAQPYIRGVGNADNTGFAVSGVAFNVDGIYVAQPIAYGDSLFDIDRVEVVKGPQGTLYGRNATGGAINILTKSPTDALGGYLMVDVGNYDLVRTSGAINGALSPTVDIRAAFQATSREGYFDDGTSDDKSQQGRVRLKWKPNADLTAQLNLQATHSGGDGAGGAFDTGTTYNLPNPWDGTLGKASKPLVFSTDTSKNPRIEQRDLDINGQIDYTVGDLTFTLLPAYREVRLGGVSYSQGFLINTDANTYHETSMEARVSYTTDRLKVISGLYYFNQDQTVNFNVNFDVLRLTVAVPDLNTRSYAGFTQATYSLTPEWRAIGGIRYSYEQQSGNGVDVYTVPPLGPFAYAAAVQSHSIDWKAGSEYDLTSRNMLYATASTGYKAGGFFPSPSGPLGSNTYQPEHLLAYDVGLRNQFFDNTVQINVEGFYWIYKDKQETFTGLDGLGLVDNITRNAGRATSTGGDLDATWAVTPVDRLHFGVEYLSAFYSDYKYQTPFPSSGCKTAPAGIGPIGPFFEVNCDGQQMARSPNWSGTLNYDHHLDLGSIGTLDLSGSATFATSRWLAANYLPNQHAPGYGEGSLFATYTMPNGRYSVTGYIRNISNAVVATNSYPSLLPNVSTVSLNPPRTFGVQLRADF